ncbi:hypothetical protein CYMTET_17642 [Cymbomonas tetramitiformis]|uniref:Uncharacterized protein n=1 Tax=Cymbomonas tetramitiformis TaxID=36881 RepID=A0AAE0L6X4_9CHLO|nr:hypothetical protein CYMTET_17642 [Cymbomonas tetramitiformis]
MPVTRSQQDPNDPWAEEDDFPTLGTGFLPPNQHKRSLSPGPGPGPGKSPSPQPASAPPVDQAAVLVEILKQQLLQHSALVKHQQATQLQQTSLITTMTGQIANLTAEVAANKITQAEASASGSSATTKKKGADAEISKRKLLVYVLIGVNNPFPPRPKNLNCQRMPQTYPLYGDKGTTL